MSRKPPRDADGARREADDDDAAPAGRGFFHVLDRIEVRFTQVTLVAMTLLVLISAIARTMRSPVSWAVDLATFTFAWVIFVGADIALRRGKMVSIDILVDLLPARFRRWVDLGNAVLMAAFLAVMVVTGFMLVRATVDRTFSGLPWLSYSWVTLAVPVGCLLMLLTMSQRIKVLLTASKEAPR